jgi:hypothetical protein
VCSICASLPPQTKSSCPVAFFPTVAYCPAASKALCRRSSFRNTERTPEKNRSQGPCRGHRFLLRIPLCWHAVCYFFGPTPWRDPPCRKRYRPGERRGASLQERGDKEFNMSRSRGSIVPPAPMETVQTPPSDSPELKKKSADPRGERQRTEADRNRKKEGHEDRHDQGRETHGERPVGASVSFPEMFFG